MNGDLPPRHVPRLEDKVALITGAARGIGEGIARAFHREGATVLLTDVRDEPGVRTAAFVADTPSRRSGRIEEVADLAVYLASDESAYTTGAELNVDGGISAGSAGSPGGGN